MDPNLRKQYFDLQGLKPAKCLYPFFECNAPPIKAHSIQNASVLSLLEKDNHVIQLKSRFDKSGCPSLDFRLVGRNEASTFLGLCSEHDGLLFKSIDDYPIDTNNQHQLFLLAYRSILKEYHASVSAFIKTQRLYQAKVEKGYVPGHNEEIDIIPIVKGCNAYDTHLYKNMIDAAFHEGKFDYLRHIVIEVDIQPSIACSQLFSVDTVRHNDDVLRIVMNIFPVAQKKTLVIYSATASEIDAAATYLSRCLDSNANYAQYEISKMVIRNSENFFVSPSLFKEWSVTKRNAIINYFERTMTTDEDRDSIEYYLFY